MSFCCAKCFGDRGLEKELIPILSSSIGNCDYCGEKDVSLVEPKKLADYFSLLIAIYSEDPDGDFLVSWLKADWALFSHPKMDVAHSKELLSDILDDGEIVRKKFAPSEKFKTDRLDRWVELSDELKYENRFFPEPRIDFDRFEELLSRLIIETSEVATTWYRARIQSGDKTFKIDEMGAPPRRDASHGRANPAGIPYLYLGSIPKTAISEVRPHTGEKACVCEFTTSDELKLVDLRNPRALVSPFLLGDENEIGLLRGDIEFLERLGEELTRPVLPQSAAIDYIPSQYLCEFIKKCGFDGVLYRSSVSEGVNLALFDPDKAKPQAVTQYTVGKVNVEIS